MTESSIYDRIGGQSAVSAATELFYRKVLADPVVAGYFDDIDMDAQLAKQAAFLTMVLGGPNNYTGRDLRAAHARLAGLDDEHFDHVATHLEATLRELGVGDAEVKEIMGVAGGARDDVLNR